MGKAYEEEGNKKSLRKCVSYALLIDYSSRHFLQPLYILDVCLKQKYRPCLVIALHNLVQTSLYGMYYIKDVTGIQDSNGNAYKEIISFN